MMLFASLTNMTAVLSSLIVEAPRAGEYQCYCHA